MFYELKLILNKSANLKYNNRRTVFPFAIPMYLTHTRIYEQ